MAGWVIRIYGKTVCSKFVSSVLKWVGLVIFCKKNAWMIKNESIVYSIFFLIKMCLMHVQISKVPSEWLVLVWKNMCVKRLDIMNYYGKVFWDKILNMYQSVVQLNISWELKLTTHCNSYTFHCHYKQTARIQVLIS